MPIQHDASNPVKTVDFNGKLISTTAEKPVKTVDSFGREIAASAEPKTEPITTETANPAVPANAEDKTPENPETAARKLFLKAQKAERAAAEMEKKAKAGLAKADAIEKAIALAQSGEDPVALLKGAGIDPIDFYKKMTDYALRPESKPEDPVQKELREHKERLNKYEEDLKVQTETIKQREEVVAKNQIITASVIPLLQNNADKYECLIKEYGNNAAVQIFNEVYEHWQKTGEQVSFEVAADALEKYWSDQIESGLNVVLQMKKFQNRAQRQEASNRDQTGQQETPRPSVTLSGKHPATPIPQSKPQKEWLTREERIADILNKY